MHFFIDYTKLPSQSSGDMKFGPDLTDATSRVSIFNITTQFQLAEEAKAYACKDGAVIIQQNEEDSSLVNLILKPTVATEASVINVKYYIYRGLKLSSFFSGTAPPYSIIPNSGSNSELLDFFWQNQEDMEAADQNYQSPTPLNFGFGDLLPSSGGIFDDSLPIDDVFSELTNGRSVKVIEGMWIGDFGTSSKIGLEVVLESELSFPFDLKFCRQDTTKIDVSSLTGIELRLAKERILNFIDPAAYFGMHSRAGVYTHDQTPPSEPKNLPGTLYSALLTKFTNKHRTYLDIRNEKGRSYNYYDNYKVSPTVEQNIRLNGSSEANAETYEWREDVNGNPENMGWPLMFLNSSINENENKHRFSVRLRINGNTNPVLFIEDRWLSTNSILTSNREVQKRFNFLEKDDLLENEADAWTNDITFYYLHDKSLSNQSNAAGYIRLFYFVGGPIATVGDFFINQKYYDSAFCSIDLLNIDVNHENGYVESGVPSYIKEELQEDGTGNFQFVAETGATWDENRVLFFAKNRLKQNRYITESVRINNTEPERYTTNEYYKGGSGKRYLNTYERKLNISNQEYELKLKEDFNAICRLYDTNDGDIRVLGINSYKKGNVLQEKEDLLLLGITRTEYNDLIETTGFSNHYHRYILLIPDAENPLCDNSDSHHRYHKYEVKLQGINSNGDRILVNTNLELYSRDNVFFVSSDFTVSEDVPDVDHRIEFHIYHDNVIKITDNIDLSLLRKAVLTDQHTTTPEPPLGPNDTSLETRIYYIYFAALVNGQPIVRTPIFEDGFSVVMSDRMILKLGDYGGIPSTPPGYTQFISYTGVNVDANSSLRHNTDRHIVTIGGPRKLYLFQGKKVFLIHFIDPDNNGNWNNALFTGGNNTLGLLMNYAQTKRSFGNPAFVATVLGGLRSLGLTITSTGLSYGDSTCYPSQNHVNGLAMDTSYRSGSYKHIEDPPGVFNPDPNNTGEGTAEENGEDRGYIVALKAHGVEQFIIGWHKLNLYNILNNEPSLRGSFRRDGLRVLNKSTPHDNHLHYEYVKITDGQKDLPLNEEEE